jgi:hypothetical protein
VEVRPIQPLFRGIGHARDVKQDVLEQDGAQEIEEGRGRRVQDRDGRVAGPVEVAVVLPLDEKPGELVPQVVVELPQLRPHLLDPSRADRVRLVRLGHLFLAGKTPTGRSVLAPARDRP